MLMICCLTMTMAYEPALVAKTVARISYQEEVVDKYSFKEQVETLSFSEESSPVLYHNNGSAIETDIFKDGESDGNYVLAILKSTENGKDCESVYFANRRKVSRSELDEMVADSMNMPVPATVNQEKAVSSYIRKYNWTFSYGNLVVSKLSTAVSLEKQTGKADVNGVRGSVWDVSSLSMLDRAGAIRLNNQYTRLSVAAFGAESMVGYGPKSDATDKVSFSVDGGGVPSVSYDYTFKGFSLKDLSSLSGNYGRWCHKAPVVGLSANKLVTEPAIRATNTRGNFGVELSHTVNQNVTATASHTSKTGIVQIFVADR